MSGKVFKNTIIVLAGILVAVLLAIFLFGYIKGFSAKSIYKKLVPGSVEGIYKAVKVIEHDGYEGFTAASDDENIYLLEEDDIAVINTINGNISYISPEYNRPVLTSEYGQVMVYDKSTGSFSILEGGKITGEGSSEKNCLGANVLSDGFLGFVMPGSDGFRGSYILMDDKYQLIAEYSYSDRYPVSGCVSIGGDYLAIAGILENHSEKTRIDIFEVGSDNPISGKNLEYLAPMLVSFGKDSFAACGTDSLDIYSFSRNTLVNVEPGRIVLVKGNRNGLFVVTGGTGTDKMMLISENGTVEWERSIPVGTQGFELSSDHIFYWNSTETGVLEMDGTPLEIQGDPGSVKAVLELGDYKMAVVTDSNIILYEFN